MKKYRIQLMLMIVIGVILSASWQVNPPVEDMVNKILITAYYNEYKDYNNEDDYKDLNSIEKKRVKKVSSYFTDKGLESLRVRQIMVHLLKFGKAYQFNSSIDSMNIEVRDTEDPSTKVCYYDLTIKCEYIDTDRLPLYIDMSGVLAVVKENGQWKFDLIQSNRVFNEYLRMQFEEHLNR